RLGIPSPAHATALSDNFIDHIIINCFAPILFTYGKFIDSDRYRSKAIEWLVQTRKESNAITRKFENLGVPHENASDSQALIHLKSTYCDSNKCLQCAIGFAVLKGKYSNSFTISPILSSLQKFIQQQNTQSPSRIRL